MDSAKTNSLSHLEKTLLEEVVNTADSLITVNPDFKIISFNQAASRITGFSKEEALGQYCRDIFRSNLCGSSCPMKETMNSGTKLLDIEKTILNKQNREVPLSVNTNIWRDPDDNPIGGIMVFRDLTSIIELKKELLEKHSLDLKPNPIKHLKLFRKAPSIVDLLIIFLKTPYHRPVCLSYS